MKSGGIFFAAAVVLVLTLVACSKPERGSAAFFNFKGAVKRVVTSGYKAVEADGTVRKGERVGYDRLNNVCRFGEDGLMTGAEYFNEGEITKWSECFYDSDNRITRMVCHSVVLHGDSTSLWEWGEGEDYVCRTYDETGTEASESRFSRRGKRSEQTTVTPHDTVTVRIRYRRNRPVETESISKNCTLRREYRYDGKGNELAFTDYIDGKPQGGVEMEYLAYDVAGNWTSRILYDVEVDGERFPVFIEERTIEYYR